jgi:2-hydroxycyclohexanecarboxyl-CoA dehydrogenase
MSILVTGGASGIGKATAILLAEHGARVTVGDIDEQGGEKLKDECLAKGLTVDFHRLDLASAQSITDFVKSVGASVTRIDGLVNAAGWDRVEPFLENDPALWEKLIAINL